MEADVKAKKYCRICGKAHKAKYNYCKRCGVNLDGAEINEIYQSNKSDIVLNIVGSICIYIFFVALAVYIWIEWGELWVGFFFVPLIGIVPLGILAFFKYQKRWEKFIITNEKIEYCTPNKSRTINWAEFDVLHLKGRRYQWGDEPFSRLNFQFFRHNEDYPVRKYHITFGSKHRARQTVNLVINYAEKMNKQLDLDIKRI